MIPSEPVLWTSIAGKAIGQKMQITEKTVENQRVLAACHICNSHEVRNSDPQMFLDGQRTSVVLLSIGAQKEQVELQGKPLGGIQDIPQSDKV